MVAAAAGRTCIPPRARAEASGLGRLGLRWRAGAAAAIEWDAHHRYRLRVAAGGRVVTLAAAEVESDVPPRQDVAVSRDANGRVLVAWADETSVCVWEPGVARWVGRANGVTSVVAGLANHGRAIVAWGTHDGGEELNRPNGIYAAVRDAGATSFAPAVELDRAGTKTYATPRLELAVTRRASLLAWNVTERRRHRPVRVARAGARGGFGEAVTLGDGTPGSVAVRADGAALVSWTQDYAAYAALAAPGRLPSRPEIVSDADRAFALAAAFGGDGRARLAWTTHRPPQARYFAVRAPKSGWPRASSSPSIRAQTVHSVRSASSRSPCGSRASTSLR